MRFAFGILLLLGIAASSPGRAHEYTVIFKGTTNPTLPTNIFSTVPSGTPFTFTATFNASTTAVTAGTTYTGPGVTNYIDPSGTASIQFGTFSFSGSAPEFQVFSDYKGFLYGYEFTETAGSGIGFASQVSGSNPIIAPDTSLNSIQNSPFEDYNAFKNFELNTPNGDIGGVVTSFSVSIVAAPEPSSIALSLITLVVFGLLLHRRRYLIN